MKSRYPDLKTLLDTLFDQADIRVDRILFERIIGFRDEFQLRNPDHISFFSSAFFGVYIPKWTTDDNDWWFTKLLRLDEEYIEECLHHIPTINMEFKNSSNPLSITMLYLAHLAETSENIPDNLRDKYKIAIVECLNYRYVSSGMSYYFSRGPTTLAIAESVYNRLSKRFTLKMEGNWKKLIEHRSKVQTVGETTRDTKYSRQDIFIQFKDDMVIRKINAIRSTMNDTIQELNKVFRQVLDENKKIMQTKSLAADGEGVYLKELVKNEYTYQRYQEQIRMDKYSYLKTELMEIIENSLPTISVKTFRGVLEWFFSKDSVKHKKLIEELHHDVIVYAITLLKAEGIPLSKIGDIAERLRKNMIAGRTIDARLSTCKEITDKLILLYDKRKKGKNITSERTGVMLYIVLRVLLMNYYH